MRAAFPLLEVPSLSRTTLLRDDLLRADPARLAAGWAAAQLLRVDPDGRVVVRRHDGGALALVLEPATALGDAPTREVVLLGEAVLTPGAAAPAVWALAVPALEVGPGEEAAELRGGGADLDDTGAGLLTTATALLAWHALAGCCAVCGGRTKPRSAGWARRCTRCEREEYPRTDPAVICLVHDGADQVLLGRQGTWPPGRFSVLAGFVEAGESLEACVEREVLEEVGATVHDIHYLGSQPWPFPRSIMLGFEATADPAVAVVPREGEIAEARWCSRDEVREALERGEWTLSPSDPDADVVLVLPGSISIARKMLESWVAAG